MFNQLMMHCWVKYGLTPISTFSTLMFWQWRNLNKEDKEKYEEKAKRIAEEQLAKQQEATKAMNDSLQGQWGDGTGGKGSPTPQNRPGTPGSEYMY